jgi:hypothetical protein
MENKKKGMKSQGQSPQDFISDKTLLLVFK